VKRLRGPEPLEGEVSPRKSPRKALLMNADRSDTRTLPADVSAALWRIGADGPCDLREQAPTQTAYPKTGKGKKVKLPPFGSILKTPVKNPGEPFSDAFESRRALQDELDGKFFFSNISSASEG
jgi:hypothetical protein